jgi:hypothetical protein
MPGSPNDTEGLEELDFSIFVTGEKFHNPTKYRDWFSDICAKHDIAVCRRNAILKVLSDIGELPFDYNEVHYALPDIRDIVGVQPLRKH